MDNPLPRIRYTFKKSEKLCSTKVIEELFVRGKYRSADNIKIVWMEHLLYTEMPAQVVITVPKRSFKKAVHRNLLKRRMREAYRKNKYILYEYLTKINKQMAIGFIYSNIEFVDYFSIEADLILLLRKIINDHAKGN